MSHFAVLVIGSDIAAALRPFQENNMGDCPPEFMEFKDIEDEERKRYETEGTEYVQLPTGERLLPWDKRFQVPGTFGTGSDTHRDPPDSKRAKVPFNVTYPTFDAFMADWCGYKKDSKKKRYGYWENPNAKWDWYAIGGRYSDRFLTLSDPGHPCDSAKAGDLDLKAMEAARAEKAAGWWADYEKAAAKGDKGAAYFAGVKEGEARGDFIARVSRFSAFAVVKDGKWYERGSMGWWGCVSDEKDPGAWEREFDALLRGLPPDTLLTIVDCHI